MHRRPALWLAALAFVLAASSATGAPRDAAATKKIDEAINTHYLATDFDKAEAVLTGTINACGDKCSPGVIAKAWMYVGIVRGSGKNDQKGAADAFKQAVAADPGVKLDEALATPETKKTFEASGAGGSTPPTGTGGSGGGEKPPKGEDVPGSMDCQPPLTEVQTRRPIPLSCTTEEEAVKAELRYKEFGGEKWKTIKMNKRGDFFQAEIPCSATTLAGSLRFYVRAQDAAGDVVDTYGSKSKPVEVSIVGKTDAEPPAFPDKDPPARCAEEVECPPDFPGCKSGGGPRGDKGWGSSCDSTQECQSGLACINGSCETAQSCDIDADCPSGKCVSGTCQAGDGPSGPYKKNWLGFHVAQDFAIVGGDNVCSQQSQDQEGFACFYSGTENQYRFDPQPGRANKITTGMAPATTRFLLSFDRALTPNISLGARAGFAIGGGPAAGPNADVKFLPFHGEVRGTYWIGGKDVLAKKGLRPYVHAGGGIAQVDAKLPVTVVDCANGEQNPAIVKPLQQDPTSTYNQCKNAAGAQGLLGTELKLDAYKKLGQSFVGIGGGAVYALSPNSGIQLNLNVMFMLPTSGQVIEPSLGYVFGL